MEEKNRYEDIIHLPHHVSSQHPQMPLSERAAQFSPFAALTGYGAAIQETARLTDRKPEPSEGERERLDQRLALAAALQEDGTRPLISITYFIPDAKKSGGAFSTASGRIFKIDAYARQLILEDPEGNRIPVPLEQVLEIEGEVFSKADPFCE